MNAPLLAERMLKRLWCWIFGHRFYVHQKFHSWSRRVCCEHCDGDWGMNDDCRALIPWTQDLEDLYRMQGHRILKR